MGYNRPHYDSLSPEERDGLHWRIMQNLQQGVYDAMDPQDVCLLVADELEEMAKQGELIRECRDEYEAHRRLIRYNMKGLGSEGEKIMMADPPMRDEEAAKRPDIICRNSHLIDRLFPNQEPKSELS